LIETGYSFKSFIFQDFLVVYGGEGNNTGAPNPDLFFAEPS